MPIRNLRQFCLYSVAGTISLMPLLVLPGIVGVLVDESGMSESLAGMSMSINFMGGAMIAILMAFRMHRLDLRRVATAAFLIAAVLDIVSGLAASNTMLFLPIRFLAGICTGAAYTCVLGAFARCEDVDRGYGIFVTLQFIASGVGLYILPVYAYTLGTEGMFMMLAGLNICALFIVRHIPGKAIDAPVEPFRLSEKGILFAPATMLAVFGYSIFEAANTAQFTYIERFGVSVDLADQQLGAALLVMSLAGIPGAFVIVLTGHRFGRIGPIATGIVLSMIGMVVLINTDSFLGYMIGGCIMGFSWAYCLPFIAGLLASMDSNGSAIAAGASLSTIGGAVGPGIGAAIVGDGQYATVFLTTIGLFVIALSAFLMTGARLKARVAEAI